MTIGLQVTHIVMKKYLNMRIQLVEQREAAELRWDSAIELIPGEVPESENERKGTRSARAKSI